MLWNTNTLWFEVAVVGLIFSLGHILMGHFEERTSRWRKLLKFVVTLIIVITLSVFFGRTVAFGLLILMFLPVIYIHGIWLPRRGINGWTAEPKSKYYEFRNWDKNIFKEESLDKQEN